MTGSAIAPSPGSTRRAAVPARPVVLADGQSWGLALPTARYRPEVVAAVDSLGRSTEMIRLNVRTGYPWAIEQLVEELRFAACLTGSTPASERRRFDALMTLAVALLQRAHDLSTNAAVDLLDLDSPGLIRLVDAVLSSVAGCAADPN